MPIESSTVTTCSPVGLVVALGAAQAGQDQRLTAGDHVRAVELGRDVHGEVAGRASPPRCARCRGSPRRSCRPRRRTPAPRPSCIARSVSTESSPCSRLRLEAELVAAGRRAGRRAAFSQTPMVRSPCTLEWPRTGHSPAPGLPMLPRRSSRLVISWIVATAPWCWVRPIAQQTIDAVGLRGSAGRPARSRRGSARSPRRTSSQSSLSRWATVLVVLGGVRRRRTPRRPPRPRSVSFAIAANSAWSPPSRTWRKSSVRSAPLARPVRGLRVVEPAQPGLVERVDVDDVGAVALRLLQRREHPRVVGAGVLADDHDQVGGVDVLEQHRPLADPDRVGERGAAGLVAHVRAVGQVVGAEAAHHQLVEERRLVARCGPRCRTPRRPGSAAPRSRSAISVERARPRRSARSGRRPAGLYIGSVSRPCWPSQ